MLPGAHPATLASAGDAQYVVRSQCGVNASSGGPSLVLNDGFGVWLGIVGAAGATVRDRASGWAIGGPSASTTLPSDAFLFSELGRALWGAAEPDVLASSSARAGDEPCVRVTASGELDDVPCWITLAGACCQTDDVRTPSQTATGSQTGTPSSSATAMPTASSSCAPGSTYTAAAFTPALLSSSYWIYWNRWDRAVYTYDSTPGFSFWTLLPTGTMRLSPSRLSRLSVFTVGTVISEAWSLTGFSSAPSQLRTIAKVIRHLRQG